jgi:hypothetical protein
MAGDHTVYVEVADRFGNVSAPKTWTFKVEENPPTITALEPATGSKISTATPGLSASFSDSGSGIDVSSVALMLNGVVLPATVTESQASYKVLTPLKVGVDYKLTVEVADKAGNSASDSATFSLETDPPKITITDPKSTVDEDDAAKGILIAADLSDDGSGVDPDSVMVWLDGEVIDADATADSVQYTTGPLAYGEHSIRVVAADMLGNTADESKSFKVDDSTPPTVRVISPKDGETTGLTPVIKISYADEGSGVDLTSITVEVDGEPVVATSMAPAKPSGANVVAAGEASYETKLGYGAHTLTVVVSDVAGNKIDPVEVNFTVEGDVLKLIKAHNYPNPFGIGSSDTTIAFGLSRAAEVTITIYDWTTTLVATIAEDQLTQASDEVKDFSWDGTVDSGDIRRLANGIYFCKIVAKTDNETNSAIVKIALVREKD